VQRGAALLSSRARQILDILARGTWRVAYGLADLYGYNSWLLDHLFRTFPDFYHMRENVPERFGAIAKAIRAEFGTVESILDVAVHEGYALNLIAREVGARRVKGLDVSCVALQRAREECVTLDASFEVFNLNALYRNPSTTLPLADADMVLVSEVLYYVGWPFPHLLWRHSWVAPQAKCKFLEALRRNSRKGIIVQHAGHDVRASIRAIVISLGGWLVDEKYGVYFLPALGGIARRQPVETEGNRG
jgi:hypothetical protein